MLDKIQNEIDQLSAEHNNRTLPNFEGYSPFEMHHLLHGLFENKSVIQFQKLKEEEYQQIPLFNLVKYLTNLILKADELKLTAKGFLPQKVVLELYAQGFYKERYIESGSIKLYKELDAYSIRMARIITELSGIVKKRNNKLSLTQKGQRLVRDNHQLLLLILNTFCTKYNWEYYGYGNGSIGQLGVGFSLLLLSKYGQQQRSDKFYSDKYFEAFPLVKEEAIVPTYTTLDRYLSMSYSARTFTNFLHLFGLVTMESQGEKYNADSLITKSPIYDQLIQCKAHTIYQ